VSASVSSLTRTADPGFVRGGGGGVADHGERALHEPKRGSGVGSPAGSSGRAGWLRS